MPEEDTFYAELRRHLGEVFRKLAQQKESRIEEGHLMPDHVHMMTLRGGTFSKRCWTRFSDTRANLQILTPSVLRAQAGFDCSGRQLRQPVELWALLRCAGWLI
jgi:hypothetical protein